jgi:hypothetical protein
MTLKLLATLVALVALVTVSGGLLLLAGPAGAVQTNSLGLTAVAGPGGTTRSLLAHPASGSRVVDGVEITNRTPHPLEVILAAVGVTRSAQGIYQLGAAGGGLARDITLGAQRVDLRPRQAERIPVSIRTTFDRTSTRYAAVTATAGSSADISSADISSAGTPVPVVQRLAVLVELTPAAHPAGPSQSPVPPLLVAVGVLLLLLAGLFLARQWRTRRTDQPRLTAPTA